MKKFLKYIFKIAVLIMLILTIVDALYTYVYTNCIPRNKLQFVLKNNDLEYHNVFLGSSRVANHIDVKLLDSLSTQKNLNLGVEGANYSDNLLMLKLYLNNNNKIRRLFFQLDHFYENNEMSAIANSDALPFIRNEVISSHFKKYDKQYYSYYYLPFYRYQSADYKIGFREFFMSLINKRPRVDFYEGYIPKYGNADKLIPEIFPKTIADNNEYLNEIISICQKKDIDLILFCAPFSSNTDNRIYMNQLLKKYPTLYNYSNTIDDIYFKNSSHLNDEGAKIFTKLIFENHIINGSKK